MSNCVIKWRLGIVESCMEIARRYYYTHDSMHIISQSVKTDIGYGVLFLLLITGLGFLTNESYGDGTCYMKLYNNEQSCDYIDIDK